MDIFLQFLIPALAGVGVGVLSGLLGIGGGTVMVPVFRLCFGMSAIVSTATSLFAIIPTSISGAITHLRKKTCLPLLGLAAGLGGALTSPVGVWLAHCSPDWLVMLAAALIIGYSAMNMFKKAMKAPKGVGRAKAADATNDQGADGRAASDQPANDRATDKHPVDDRPRLSPKQLGVGVLIGLAAGLASGYVGVGGGFIMVPFMLTFLGISMRHASGTSLIAVMILAVPGVIEQALLGSIDYVAGLSLAVGSIPGAVIGARLVSVVPERALRFTFGSFLLVAAALLAVSDLGILG